MSNFGEMIQSMSDFNRTIDLNKGLEKILERINEVADDLQKRETKN